MCIIAFKEKGVAPVDKDTLQRCFNKNSDGAGFAYLVKKTWYVEKGLMTFEDFWEAYSAHKFKKEDCVICHFRVGTSGNRKGPDCTHPFVIKTGIEWEEDDEKYLAEMRKLKYRANGIVFHNGVVGPGEGISSDTMLAVKDWIAPIWRIMHRGKILDIMCKATDSDSCRWLVTRGENVFLLGKWITDKDTKIIYSNDGYKYIAPAATHHHAGNQNRKCGWWKNACDPKFTNPVTGDFDWELYHEEFPSSANRDNEKVNDNWSNSKSEWAGKTPEQLGGVEFIVDDDGCPFGLIDHEGNVILDDEYYAFDNAGKPGDKLLICPQCKEQHNINESPYPNIGDSLCMRCGCVFVESTGEMCMNDPELHKMWIANLKQGGVANGNK
jgi:hypothetical protein